jgi:hypothetical protein
MGGFSSQVQRPQSSQPTSGKGGANAVGQALPQQAIPIPNQMPDPTPESVAQPAVMPQGGGGKGQRNYEQPAQYSPPDGTMSGKGSPTNSATSGQPRMGQPNNYANTIPQWDNASQQLTQPAKSSGKGKGG